jgi:hypothetical protein
MNQMQKMPVDAKNLTKILEPLIRRIIREELTRMAKKEPGMFYLSPGMPLYSDMEDILQRKTKGKSILHSHEDVWGE